MRDWEQGGWAKPSGTLMASAFSTSQGNSPGPSTACSPSPVLLLLHPGFHLEANEEAKEDRGRAVRKCPWQV